MDSPPRSPTLDRAVSSLKSFTPRKIWASIRDDLTKTKRVFKVMVALTSAIAFTLPPIFSNWHGQNPYLIGTMTIYLFPTKTVGSQLVHTAIGLSGIILGLAYANLCIFIANALQGAPDSGDIYLEIGVGRRVFLWCALWFGAFLCGYVRSKITRSYLAINFFQVVNMFALIRGINHFHAPFREFFYVMLSGVALSLVVCVVLWPEDMNSALRATTLGATGEVRGVLRGYEAVAMSGLPEEVKMEAIEGKQRKLSELLHEARYEISFSRVDSARLLPINRCLERILGITRVFNAGMRRRRRNLLSLTDLNRVVQNANSDGTMRALEEVFKCALEVVDESLAAIEKLFRGRDFVLDREKLPEAVDRLCNALTADIAARMLVRYEDLEDAAFTDQSNTCVLDLVDVIIDLERIISLIEPCYFRPTIPRALRRNRTAKRIEAHEPRESDVVTVAADAAYLQFLESTTWYDKVQFWITEKYMALERSRHVKYAVKFAVAMGALSLPAYIAHWHIWYERYRCQLAMISAMVAMESTRGMTFRTAFMKLFGALLGGFCAVLVVIVSRRNIVACILLTLPTSILIALLHQHSRFSKSGTVCALAYNLILSVAIVYPDQGSIAAAFARRLLTLPVGLSVAMYIHLTLYPYHSRSELVRGLSSTLDWLHHLLFAIDASVDHPHLESKFDQMARKASSRLAHSRSLLPATLYEVSLSGHWPYERFQHIIAKIEVILDIIVGGTPAEPELHVHLDASRTSCLRRRSRLLAALCNDLLVISHSLAARLHMPRHDSIARGALDEYQRALLVGLPDRRDFNDVGRLADLVSEIAGLREEVDELTAETQSPSRSLMPHLSFIVVKRSRANTPSGSRSVSRAPSRSGSRSVSRAPSPNRSGSRSISRAPSSGGSGPGSVEDMV